MKTHLERDKETIEDTSGWHHWNILPLKEVNPQPGKPREVGFIMANNKLRVYVANMFDIDPKQDIDKQGFKYIDYPSIDNLLITWQVD